MVGPLDTQAVGHGRYGGTVGVSHVPRGHLSRQRRELVHDHLGLCGRHRSGDRVGVEGVGNDWMCSQAAHQVLLGRAFSHPDHLVASRHEVWHERPPENACGARYEDLHGRSFRLMILL
jgi:hypothetical protein